MDDLARGELAFFQGDIHAAEPLIASALEHAREHVQFETVHRALYYSLRAAVAQGKLGAENLADLIRIAVEQKMV